MFLILKFIEYSEKYSQSIYRKVTVYCFNFVCNLFECFTDKYDFSSQTFV